MVTFVTPSLQKQLMALDKLGCLRHSNRVKGKWNIPLRSSGPPPQTVMSYAATFAPCPGVYPSAAATYARYVALTPV